MTSLLRCAAALVAVFSFSLPVQIQSSIQGLSGPRDTRSAARFQLKADFWADDTMNSAIFVRCPTELKTDLSSKTCYEVNIYDPHASWPTGSVNEVQTTLPERIQTAGKWNSYEIMLEGSRIAVKLNGKTTVDARNDLFTSGTIAVVFHFSADAFQPGT